MKLTNEQIYKYREKIHRLVHISPVINYNGIFELYNIAQNDVNRITNLLKSQDYILSVNTQEGSYDFGHPFFNNGFAEFKKKYTIRGLLNENKLENLQEEVVDERVEIHDTLNPKLWNEDNTLKEGIKEKIEEIVTTFKETLLDSNLELNIKDIYLLGSNVNFNYNSDSDLDIHIMSDMSKDCVKSHLKVIYDAYKKMFNEKYNISIKGINVELYVEDINHITNNSGGVYSLTKGWIKKPSKVEIPEINYDKIDKEVNKWESKFVQIRNNPTIEAIDSYIDSLYQLRNNSFKEDGEFAEGNLVFKEVRRLGYLTELRDIKTSLYSNELSLE